MTLLDALSTVLVAGALFFFTAGTVGLVRLPDLHSRLHALTKADNVGLGLAVLALIVQAESFAAAFKLALIWVLISVGGATVCFLIASRACRGEGPSDEGASP